MRLYWTSVLAITTLFLIIVFIFGWALGQRSYQNGCEEIGNAQGQRWLECDK